MAAAFSSPSDSQEMELHVLRALCQAPDPSGFRERVMRLLGNYRFRVPAHQLVFDALRSVAASDPQGLRPSLVRRLTTMGFPDLDVDPYFMSPSVAEGLVLTFAEQLAANGGSEPHDPADAG